MGTIKDTNHAWRFDWSDLDCSGLPVSGETVCDYDEGFIAGIMHTYYGREFVAREIDCWASGGRICRFEVKPLAADLDAG